MIKKNLWDLSPNCPSHKDTYKIILKNENLSIVSKTLNLITFPQLDTGESHESNLLILDYFSIHRYYF